MSMARGRISFLFCFEMPLLQWHKWLPNDRKVYIVLWAIEYGLNIPDNMLHHIAGRLNCQITQIYDEIYDLRSTQRNWRSFSLIISS